MTTIEINGHQVSLIRQGSGQPVVLLHCSGATGAQWHPLIESLSTQCLVLAPDLDGHGGTAPWPGLRAYSLADEAALVGALVDTLDEPAHIVGHSYGAATALHLARARAGQLRSLTLIEPVAFHLLRGGDDGDTLALNEFAAVGHAMQQARRGGDPEGALGHFVDYWHGPGTWASMGPDKRAAMLSGPPVLDLQFPALISDPARLADFSRMDAPTLLVQGTRTTLAARRLCQRLAQAWPLARVELVGGAGHMSPLTHRDQVNALVTAHLLASADTACFAEARCS
ncbi:MAG TPA: alpha/beta fold hydrolase [Ramlibacter sp.]|nr:alpha/beta fold hydrolase [Ramlibacter sp.]